jgi:hypothetical protein
MHQVGILVGNLYPDLNALQIKFYLPIPLAIAPPYYFSLTLVTSADTQINL